MIVGLFHYYSRLGSMVLAIDEGKLKGAYFSVPARRHLYGIPHLPEIKGDPFTALNFEGGEHVPFFPDYTDENRAVYAQTCRWLDIYFAGQIPDFLPPIELSGPPMYMAVWKYLQTIPYGQTTTYGAIAQIIARERGQKHMSSQAIGNAVGRNPIAVIIPCHRVIGARGRLTGYAGGLERKMAMLWLEKVKVIPPWTNETPP